MAKSSPKPNPKTNPKPPVRAAKTSVAKATKPHGLAGTLMLGVLAVVGGIVVYKQMFLAGSISSQLPREPLTHSLEACMQKNISLNMLKTDLQSGQAKTAATGLDLQGLLGGMLSQVSSSVVQTKITQNYITEVKVLKIEDFFGNNAEIRVSGSVDLLSKMPVVGETKSKKDYQTSLFKRGNEYYFNQVSVKKPDSAQWDQWNCAQTLVTTATP